MSDTIPPRPPLPGQPEDPDAGAQQGDAKQRPGTAHPAAAGAPYTAPLAHPLAGAASPGGSGSAGASAFGAPATGVHHTLPTQPYGTAPASPAAAPAADGKVGAGKIVAIMVAAALVGGAAGLGATAAGASFLGAPQTVVTTGSAPVTVNNPDKVNATTAIAAKTVPSVVTISASSGSSGGTGSGVVLSEDGYVVTNTHVVTLDGATGDPTLKVTASDGKVYAATIVGTDPLYDLAVIKLEGAEGLTPIEFAASSELNVGDETVAVGAPLGLSNTVTTGIVSALNRSISIASAAAPSTPSEGEQGQESPFQFDFGPGQGGRSPSGSISIAVIQTDAAINPGNSGGALVDGEGRLIGINVAIATAGGTSTEAGSIGVGFSIPSDIAKRIADEIITDGVATHGLLGAMVGDAAAREDATIAGAYISEVTGGGAAADSGLRPGDVVTSFNGLPITDATDLTAQVRALAAGSEATIVYVRDGETRSADVTLGTLEQ